MDHLLVILLTTAFIATLVNVFLQRYEIPTVIGYIFAGTAISQLFGLGHAEHHEGLHQLGEFGIVFLMFTIGLEFSVRHLKAMKREVFLYGALQVLITGIFFATFAHKILEIELKSAIIIGYSLALSSTAIVLKMLTQKQELHSGFGRISLGILLFQDLAVIPILLMLSLFGSPERSLSDMIFWTLLDAIVLLFIIYLLGRFAMEPFLQWTLEANSEEIFLVAALMLVVGISYLAHFFGFSYSLGAFLAGMALAETRFKYRIEADLLTFRDIFLGIFFVTVGMQIDPSILLEHGGTILLLLLGIMASKALLIFVLLYPFLQRRTAFKSALTLMQVGEFALAIFAMASQNALIDSEISQILILVVVLSMILTPFVLNNLKALADRLFDENLQADLSIVSSGYKNHILLLGYGPLGQKLAKELKKRSLPFLIIEHDYKLVKEAQERGEAIILANAAAESVLKSAGIQDALSIIVAIENPAKTRMVVDAVTRISPHVNTVVAVRNLSHQRIIETFPVDHIINTGELLSREILTKVLYCHFQKPQGETQEKSSKNSL